MRVMTDHGEYLSCKNGLVYHFDLEVIEGTGK